MTDQRLTELKAQLFMERDALRKRVAELERRLEAIRNIGSLCLLPDCEEFYRTQLGECIKLADPEGWPCYVAAAKEEK